MINHVALPDYHAQLKRLPIVNPTEEDMAKLCPHLTPAQAVAAFTDVRNRGHVACPPLHVRGAYHALNFSRRDPQWIAIHHAFVGHVAKGSAPAHAMEAATYADMAWGDHLTGIVRNDVIRIHVQDPTDLHAELGRLGFPKRTFLLTATLSGRRWDEITDDQSRPRSELLDDCIVELTHDELIGKELAMGRSNAGLHACAYCGHWLGFDRCQGCGHSFRSDGMRSIDWQTPLSKRMVELLQEHGHVFRMDPQKAWDAERKRHASLNEKTRSHQDESTLTL